MKSLFGLSMGFAIGLIVALSFTFFAGENPLNIFSILVKSAVASKYDLGLTLYYATGLTFTGLAVAVAYLSGLFNIGAEGQLHIAAIAAALIGAKAQGWPEWLTWMFLIVAPLILSGLWAALAGYLKAYRGSHEVIVTIMMNFISLALCSYMALTIIPNPDSQNPESMKIQESFLTLTNDSFKTYFDSAPVSSFLIVALVLSMALGFIYQKTSVGFLFDAIGENPDYTARLSFSVPKLKVTAMFISGALAGLCGLNEVLGNTGQYKIGFSPEFGFLGIAVAMMSQNNPWLVPLSSFLLAGLHKGASDLDLETSTITRDFSKILQASIILGVSLQFLLPKMWTSAKSWPSLKKARPLSNSPEMSQPIPKENL